MLLGIGAVRCYSSQNKVTCIIVLLAPLRCQVAPIVAPCNCAGQPWRARIQRMVLSTSFNNWVIGVLVVNAIVLAVGETFLLPPHALQLEQ